MPAPASVYHPTIERLADRFSAITVTWLMVPAVTVPAPEIDAGRSEAGALAERLQKIVIRDAKKPLLGPIKVQLQEAGI